MNLEIYLIAQESMNSGLADITSPEELYKWMTSHMRYRDFIKLQSPEETERLGCGSCHDQVLFEIKCLRAMHLKVKTIFFMEIDESSGQGGMTHSFVVYTQPEHESTKQFWFEHAADDWSGIHTYASMNAIRKFIIDEHARGKWGNHKKYPTVVFGTLQGNPGDSLQTIVNKSLGD